MPDSEKACPICGKPPTEAALPFCSPRCAQIDLGRWFGGRYVVPGRDGEALEPLPQDEA
jgi:endogenous inhibitor of DNA gyrase (YacG/DUF329 family)